MVNTVGYETGVVVNADGLQQKYGTAEALKGIVSKATNSGDTQQLIVDIDYRRLPAFSATEDIGRIYGSYSNNAIPAGAFIESINFTPTVAFAGTGATLSVGLVTADGTEIDNDGIIDAVALTAIDTIGETYTTGGALVGNNNGAVLSTTGYIWVSVQVATYTAGTGRLVINYRMPRSVV